MKRWICLCWTTLSLVLVNGVASGAAMAQERPKSDAAAGSGNQELPKVLYIVPWKKSVQGEEAGRPPVSVVNEELAPIDQEVFRRQMQYQSQLLSQRQAKAGGATGKPANP